MILTTEVWNKTSPVFARVIENENGEAISLNCMLAFLEKIPADGDGRGRILNLGVDSVICSSLPHSRLPPTPSLSDHHRTHCKQY